MGKKGPHYIATDEQIIAAAESGGCRSCGDIGRMFGVTRQAINLRINEIQTTRPFAYIRVMAGIEEGKRRSRRAAVEREKQYDLERGKWYNKTPQQRVRDSMGSYVWKALQGSKDGESWLELAGYSAKQLFNHLEGLFSDGMTWENYGRNGWHVDHIIPASWWKYETPEDPEFKQCWALANLQPLWASDNFAKRDRYAG